MCCNYLTKILRQINIKRECEMNKKLEAVLLQAGFTMKGAAAYAKYKGYEMNVTYVALDNVSPVRVHVSCHTTDEAKSKVLDEFRSAAIKYAKPSFTAYGFLLGLNDFTIGKLAGRLMQVIDFTVETLKNAGALGEEYCPVCGKELSLSEHKEYVIDGATITADVDCIGDINKLIETENADFVNAPNNYLKGFGGALIGGLVGAALCIGIYAAGFISSISAFVAVFLGWFLYKKFGGKQNWGMIAIVSVVSIVCIVAAYLGTVIVSVGLAYNDLGLTGNYLDFFNLEMKANEEFRNAFSRELIFVIVFSLLGIAYMIFAMIKSIKRPTTIK